MTEEREIFPDDLYEAMELQAFVQGELDAINLELDVYFERDDELTPDDLSWRHRAGRAKMHRQNTVRRLAIHIRKLLDAQAADKLAKKRQNAEISRSGEIQKFGRLCRWLSEHHPDVWEAAKDMFEKEFPR